MQTQTYSCVLRAPVCMYCYVHFEVLTLKLSCLNASTVFSQSHGGGRAMKRTSSSTAAVGGAVTDGGKKKKKGIMGRSRNYVKKKLLPKKKSG